MRRMMPLVYDTSESGHRARGVKLISQLVSGRVLIGPPWRLLARLVWHPGMLIWQTADYAIVPLTLIATLRTIFLRKTVALCYRNDRGLVGKSLRSRVRRMLVWVISHFLKVNVVFIFPPRAGSPQTYPWIFDPEWWDLGVMPVADAHVARLEGEGDVVLFIGNIDRLKGLDFFIEAAEEAARFALPLRFVLVGPAEKLTPSQLNLLRAAGATLLDALPTDSEFLAYLRRAQYLWCCYHPDYDQSSGIFGRSLQLGIPAIVRKGSLMDEFAAKFGNGVSVRFGDIPDLLQKLVQKPARSISSATFVEEFRQDSLMKLERLGTDGTR